MSGWIKFDKDMANDPRLLEMAVKFAIEANLATGNQDMPQRDAVALYGNALRGALVTLWCYADEHISDDDTLDLSPLAIDAMVGIDGFCDALPNEWLAEVEGENRVHLPGYCEKNGLISKKKRREQGAIRQQKFKERSRSGNASSNAGGNAHTDASGNAGDNASARAVDLDLDLDHKTKSGEHVNGGGKPESVPTTRPPSRARLPKGPPLKSPIPDGFELDAELLAYLAAKIPDADPAAMFEAFCGDAKAKGWKYTDWRQAWQTYVRNSAPNSGHWASGQYPKTGPAGVRWM